MSLESELVKLKALIDSDLTLEAIKLSKEIEDKILDGILESENKKDENQSDYDYFCSFPEVKLINWDENLYFRCLDNIKRVLKHDFNEKSDNHESWYFEEDDTKMITTVHKMIINAPLKKILLVLLEFKHINNLMKDEVGIIKMLKTISPYRSIVNTLLNIPFPYKNRQCLNYGNTFINHELKQLLIFTRSLTKADLEEINCSEIEVDSEEYEKLDMKFSYYTIKKLEDNKFELLCGLNADAKLSGIPDFICNSIIKNLSLNTGLKLKKIMEDQSYDSLYEQDYQDKKELYLKLIKIIE